MATLALLLGAGWANASIITYTESATASGSLGSTAFSNSLITLTFIGDTSNVTGSSGLYTNDVGALTINIASLGVTADLTDVGEVFVNQGFSPPAAGLGDQAVGSILDTLDGVFGAYGLTTAIGPITNANFINPGTGFATDDGTFIINSAGNSTFTARLGSASTPEPATIALLAMGLLGVGMRKRLASGVSGSHPTRAE
jgi:hypothetical protein